MQGEGEEDWEDDEGEEGWEEDEGEEDTTAGLVSSKEVSEDGMEEEESDESEEEDNDDDEEEEGDEEDEAERHAGLLATVRAAGLAGRSLSARALPIASEAGVESEFNVHPDAAGMPFRLYKFSYTVCEVKRLNLIHGSCGKCRFQESFCSPTGINM